MPYVPLLDSEYKYFCSFLSVQLSDLYSTRHGRHDVAIGTNLLVALRATNLLLTPTPSRDHMLLYCSVSILECYHN